MSEETLDRRESQRQRRGHDFWPPSDELAQVPKLYATERQPIADKVLWLHYFVGGCDWWVAEVDPESALAFGYACLGDRSCAEWGYVDLSELEALTVQGWLVVERDLWWTPKRASEAKLPGASS